MFVNPSKTFNLNHRVYFLSSTPTASLVLAASQDGYISIIDTEKGTLETVGGKPIAGASLHSEGSVFAVIDHKSGNIQIKNLKGLLLHEINTPEAFQGRSRSGRKSFESCFISQSGTFLLASAHVANGLIAVKCFDLQITNNLLTASLLNTVEIEDPFVGSDSAFYFAGDNLFPLWIAAGHKGQQVFWLTIEGRQLKPVQMPILKNTTPPVFSPRNGFFVVLDESGSVCSWSVPLQRQIGPPCLAPDKADPFSVSMSFINETHVLTGTANGRLFVIDTNSMSIVDEVIVGGHEPRPVSSYYPKLQGNRICTDFSFFRPLGSNVACVHRRDKGTGLEGWCDTLTFLDIHSLEESMLSRANDATG